MLESYHEVRPTLEDIHSVLEMLFATDCIDPRTLRLNPQNAVSFAQNVVGTANVPFMAATGIIVSYLVNLVTRSLIEVVIDPLLPEGQICFEYETYERAAA